MCLACNTRVSLQAEWSAYRPSFCAFPNTDGAETSRLHYLGQLGAVTAASPSPLLSREPRMVPISAGADLCNYPLQFGLVPALACSFAAAAAGCLPPVAGGIAPRSPPHCSRDPARMTHGSNPSRASGPADYNPSADQPKTVEASILVAGTPLKFGGATGAHFDAPICHNQLHDVALVVAHGQPSLQAAASYQDGSLAPAAAPVLADADDLGASDSAQDDDGGPAASVCPSPRDASGLDTAARGEQDDDSAARDCGADTGGGFGVFDVNVDGVDWLGFLVPG